MLSVPLETSNYEVPAPSICLLFRLQPVATWAQAWEGPAATCK